MVLPHGTPIGGAGLEPGRITGSTLGEGVGVAAKVAFTKPRSSKNNNKIMGINFFTKSNYTRRAGLLKLEVGDVGAGKVFDENKDEPDNGQENKSDESISKSSPSTGESLRVAAGVYDANAGHNDHANSN